MAMTGFICHDDYLNKTAKLSDEEVGRLFRACMKYNATGIAEEIEGRESIAFDFIREDIDRAKEAYTNKCETNKRNRMKALEQTLTVDKDRKQTSTNDDNIRIKIKEDNNKNNNKKDIKHFIPPTVDEVALYCSERHNHVNAGKFVDYYSSNGWRVGKNPMKDWKACVRTWERSEFTEKDYQYELLNSGLPY